MAREARLVPRFAGGPYGPGDTVEGVLVAREALGRARRLNAYLRYVDRSPSFSGAATYGSAEPLHEGPVERDQEIPFALGIPDDAYPNWEERSTADYGTLEWSLVIEADIGAGLDTTTTHAIPVDSNGRTWTGPRSHGRAEAEAVRRQVGCGGNPGALGASARRGRDRDAAHREAESRSTEARGGCGLPGALRG